MEHNKKPVLIWVTNPSACRRIINAGKKLSGEQETDLFIVSIQGSVSDNWQKKAEDLESLHRAAKEVDAELTVVYSENPFKSALEVVKDIKPGAMVAGLPGTEGRSAFLEYLLNIDDSIQTFLTDDSGNLVRSDILKGM